MQQSIKIKGKYVIASRVVSTSTNIKPAQASATNIKPAQGGN